MILREATIKYKGYDPEDLSRGSHKRICVSCDMCGRVRYVNYQAYRDLCGSCACLFKPIMNEETKRKISESHKGKNNPFYGHKHSEETKEKMSESNLKLSGDKHPMYGKHHSEATKRKMSDKQNGELNHNYGKHQSLDTRIKNSCSTRNIKIEDLYENI